MRFNSFDDFIQYLIWFWFIHPVIGTLILLLMGCAVFVLVYKLMVRLEKTPEQPICGRCGQPRSERCGDDFIPADQTGAGKGRT